MSLSQVVRDLVCGFFGCWPKTMPLTSAELENGLYRKKVCRSCGDVWVKSVLSSGPFGSTIGGWKRNGKILNGTWIKEQNLERH